MGNTTKKQRGNTDNLKPFKKGQSGNPNGRPKKEHCIADLLKVSGTDVLEDGRTKLQAIVDELYKKAQGGDLKAMEMIFDRIDGKPMQTTLTQTTELPIGFELEEI